MKICITAEGCGLDSAVDQRFGRALYFIFYDNETGEFEAVENENVSGSGGVGVLSGQLVAEKQAEVVLTGKVGPNAARTLESAGIDFFEDVEGSVREAVEKFTKGQFHA